MSRCVPPEPAFTPLYLSQVFTIQSRLYSTVYIRQSKLADVIKDSKRTKSKDIIITVDKELLTLTIIYCTMYMYCMDDWVSVYLLYVCVTESLVSLWNWRVSLSKVERSLVLQACSILFAQLRFLVYFTQIFRSNILTLYKILPYTPNKYIYVNTLSKFDKFLALVSTLTIILCVNLASCYTSKTSISITNVYLVTSYISPFFNNCNAALPTV